MTSTPQRLLTREAIAAYVATEMSPGELYPRLFTFSAAPVAPHTTEEIERAVYEEVDRLRREPPSEAELERIRNQTDSPRPISSHRRRTAARAGSASSSVTVRQLGKAGVRYWPGASLLDGLETPLVGWGRSMPLPWTELAHRSGGQLWVLSPPYKTAHVLDFGAIGTEPALGAIVLGHGPNTLAVLAELTAAVHRWPWLVPCVAIPLDQGLLEPLLMLVSELRDRLAVAKQARYGAIDDVSLILAAIRNRKPPDADVLTTWVGRRLDNPALRDAVASQFLEALGGAAASRTASASTYSRLFARFGPYTARDWRAIARLCAHCAVVGSFGTTQALPIRSANQYVKKYCHLPYHTLADRIGWEWVLEGALRAGRYAESRP